jgi:signal transduction histidine kinase
MTGQSFGSFMDSPPYQEDVPPALAAGAFPPCDDARVVGRAVPGARTEPGAGTLAGDDGELARAILCSHPSHIAVLDRTGRIVSVNEAWERFAHENGGGSGGDGAPGRYIGVDYLAVCGSASGDCAAEAKAVADGIRAVLDGRLPVFQFEYPCHSPTEQRWFLMTAGPLRSYRGGGAIVSHLDITQRKLDEENVRRHAEQLEGLTRQLARSNAELDQFAYVASHDLRAPLRGIANLSGWIEEDLAAAHANVPDEVRRMLDLLRGRVTRMEALIDGILEYSRVGRVRGKADRIDVGKLLAETIDLLAPVPPARVDVAENMPVITGDRLRLQQVFMNLIGNALKHGGRPDVRVRVTSGRPQLAQVPGSTARLSSPKSELAEVSTGDSPRDLVEFRVRDNGAGIEQRYHDKIFVIFQTLEPRDKVEGAGVGLSLVKKIVESQGGSVRLESSPGKGSTFCFTWPRSR